MVSLNSSLIIDLNTLHQNVKAISARLIKGVQIWAVIKDNAYGHGLEEVAKHLSPIVDAFCVARLDEGIRLREEGVSKPILVFEIPVQGAETSYTTFNLIATVADLTTLPRLQPGTKYHVNLDTGMHRLGILPHETYELLQQIDDYKTLEGSGLYTHFYKADDPNHPEVNEQLAVFQELKDQFPANWMKHTANSGAIFFYNHLNLQFDAVRPGVCLYGYSPGEEPITDLTPILSWKSFLMQVKRIKKGETVSYGGRWTTPSDGFLGIVPVGYSAGIARGLSNHIFYEIDGNRYPQVGTISMDYSMVWLADDDIATNTAVTILGGKAQNANDWAKILNTIPYEITTRLKYNVHREFNPLIQD